MKPGSSRSTASSLEPKREAVVPKNAGKSISVSIQNKVMAKFELMRVGREIQF